MLSRSRSGAYLLRLCGKRILWGKDVLAGMRAEALPFHPHHCVGFAPTPACGEAALAWLAVRCRVGITCNPLCGMKQVCERWQLCPRCLGAAGMGPGRGRPLAAGLTVAICLARAPA